VLAGASRVRSAASMPWLGAREVLDFPGVGVVVAEHLNVWSLAVRVHLAAFVQEKASRRVPA
jgi:hypothetical protein